MTHRPQSDDTTEPTQGAGGAAADLTSDAEPARGQAGGTVAEVASDGASARAVSEAVDSHKVAHRKLRRRRILNVVVFLVMFGVWHGLFNYELDYYQFGPGRPRDTLSLVTVDGAETYATEGELFLTTVSARTMTPALAIQTWWSDDLHAEKIENIRGDSSQTEFDKINSFFMVDSQQTAKVVALRRLGYQVPSEVRGALVAGVEEDTPASKVLTAGDTIISVNGTEIFTQDQLREQIRSVSAGESVSITFNTFNQDGKQVTETADVGTYADDDGAVRIGILSLPDLRYDLPIDINIATSNIGGPSAGLAFTLSIIDKLTDGSLTGGKRIACTGTIEPDGTVGEVGGVDDKAIAVRATKADLFLVPESEIDQARAVLGDKVEVVGVKTLEDAIRALLERGGEAKALPAAADVTLVPESEVPLLP